LPHTLFYKLKIAVKVLYRIPLVHEDPNEKIKGMKKHQLRNTILL